MNAARQVTVIAWLDSTNVFAVQGHSRAAEFLESGDLLLHNTSNLPALGWGGLHVYDHSQPNVRAIWRNNCLALIATGVLDGCGATFQSGKPLKALQ